jgi:hypothetical protein
MRTFVVPREERTLVVKEDRTFEVPRESRTFIVDRDGG